MLQQFLKILGFKTRLISIPTGLTYDILIDALNYYINCQDESNPYSGLCNYLDRRHNINMSEMMTFLQDNLYIEMGKSYIGDPYLVQPRIDLLIDILSKWDKQ